MQTYNIQQLAAAVTSETAEIKTVRVKVSGEDLAFLRQFAVATKCRRLGDALVALVGACRKQAAA